MMMWQTLSQLSILSFATVFVSAKSLRYDNGLSGVVKDKSGQQHPSSIIPGKFIVEFPELTDFDIGVDVS